MNSDDHLPLFVKAAQFAAHKHRDGLRTGSTIPYINHPLAVANVLASEGGVRDGVILAAAVLHDTMEDAGATGEELASEFGEKVARIVAEVSDDKGLPKQERKRRQVEHARHLSTEARLVKLADFLCNLRDMATTPPSSWGLERVRGYFCWAFHVVEAVGAVNEGLQQGLNEVFSGDLNLDGEVRPRLPESEGDRRQLLQAYYDEMARVDT